MPVRVKMFATLQEIARTSEVRLEAESVVEALEQLVTMHAKLLPEIFEDFEQRKLKQRVKVMVNGTDMDYLDGIRTKLKDGDRVAVFPVVAGG